MTAMPPLRDILNNTPVDATDVEYNFSTIEAHVAQELVNRDGTVAMTGALTLPGPPTAPAQAATKAYVDAYTPVGVITMFGGSAAPAGWALCDGSAKSTTDPAYASLFAVIGYTYGGSGTSFNLPNLKGRMPVGRDSGDTSFDGLGEKAGSKNAILVAHSHTVNNHTHTGPNHQHDVSHGHNGGSGQAGSHAHWAAAATDTFFAHGRLGDIAHQTAAPGSANTFADLRNIQTTVEGLHAHGVVINDFNGSSGFAGTGATGGSAPGTDSQGASGANANLPPYIVLNFIIRIG